MEKGNKPGSSDRIFICRCEEVTEAQVRFAVRSGVISVDGVKRATRAGMGLCQSKTCFANIARIIHEETGIPLEQLVPIKLRVPARPLRI